MDTPEPGRTGLTRHVAHAVLLRFSLLEDKAADEDIDRRLRAGVEMRGTNLWVLVFAIFIASVGLNVNSTAVIIGAMLISPLMGPIMGIGYGAGTSDLELIRASFKSLGFATLIALIVSTVYFLISPLRSVQSELLARTAPTLWDVLIALFGGLAGIVAATRREKTNVIPGVAIATALMPPLCTAGFGLATGNWPYFLGALYLFIINCVFIAASSAIVVRAFRMPLKNYVDERTSIRMHRALAFAVVLTIIPSLFLAYRLVQEEIFRSEASRFVQQQLDFKQTHVVTTTIDPKSRRIEVTLVGDVVPASTLAEIAARLPVTGLKAAQLKVFQTGDQRVDVDALKTNLLGDLYRRSEAESSSKDRAIEQLRAELAAMKAAAQRFTDVPAELHALYPGIDQVLLTDAPEWRADGGWNKQSLVTMSVRSSRPVSKADRAKIEAWLRSRVKADAVELVIEVRKS